MKTFNERLKEKHPSLFPKGENGEVLDPSCGAYCPPGWEPLVFMLCTKIEHLVKTPEMICVNPRSFQIKNFIFNKILRPAVYPIIYKIDPVEEIRRRNGHVRALTRKQSEDIRKQFPKRTKAAKILHKCLSVFYPSRKWKPKKEIPPVTIEQIKEKFGGLRFYYNGGDNRISAVVDFAEMLSMTICEESGQTGAIRVANRGYVRTLSPELAEKYDYK
jgi:hypothetical protein